MHLKKIKDESLTQEENITKKLYNDYSAFRNEIFDSIQKENPEYDKLTLFKKTQKLLDRFLFIFFAEDRLLLPPNSIRSIVNQWKDLRDKYDEYKPLYDRFKKYLSQSVQKFWRPQPYQRFTRHFMARKNHTVENWSNSNCGLCGFGKN